MMHSSHAGSTQQPKRISKWLYEFFRFWVMLFWTFGYRIRFTGQRNIPQDGPVLVVANHQSHFDPPLVGSGINRQISYVGRRTLFKWPLIRRYALWLGAIPIDREGGVGGVREIVRRLKKGEMVLMFPEGTRTHDGTIGRFRPGFSALARKVGAAVLPVAIEGAFECWPRHKTLPSFGIIHVHYCQPIKPDEVSKYSEEELIEEVRQRIIEAHSMLCKRPMLAKQRTRFFKKHKNEIRT